MYILYVCTLYVCMYVGRYVSMYVCVCALLSGHNNKTHSQYLDIFHVDLHIVKATVHLHIM